VTHPAALSRSPAGVRTQTCIPEQRRGITMRKDALLFGVGVFAAGLWLLVNPPRSGAG